ncbi:MAG: MerR family transcriptional regulator, partial [Flavobacteriaceae bacterium]|nr:MerR family transcriptional regulator [Flavobacteriaceae bacterium]
NEEHEIGHLYANYELLKQGYDTLYLGNNIPLKGLKHVQQQHHDTVFISYITMDPEGMHIDDYIKTFDKEIVQNNGNALWLIGQKTSQIDLKNLPTSVKTLSTLAELNELIAHHKNSTK